MANRYTDSFKRNMIQLASQDGTDITSLCKENGISRSTLYKWMSDYKPFHADTITLHEFETLKRQVETLRLENEIGSTPILVDKGQKGRGTASCNLPATRYIIEANPLNVLKPRAFRFAACIMELIPSQTAFVMRW